MSWTRWATPTTSEEGTDQDTGRPRKFAYPPNLVVVDGGPPQVNAAAAVLAELGIDDVACAAWPSGWRRCGCPARSTR